MGKHALDAKRIDAFALDPEILHVETEPGKLGYDVRSKLALDVAFVQNIMLLGVLQPVVAVKDGERPVVIYGRRRVMHAREANNRLIAEGRPPITVLTLVTRGTEDALIAKAISENNFRRDDDAVTAAENAQQLLALTNDHAVVGTVCGLSVPALKQRLKLLDLDATVQKAIRDGLISASAAITLVDLPREEQKEALAKLLALGPSQAKAKAVREGRKAHEGKMASVSKLRLRRLYKIASAEKLLDHPIAILIGWICGEDEISEDDVRHACKGFTGLFKAEEAKLAEPKKEMKPRAKEATA